MWQGIQTIADYRPTKDLRQQHLTAKQPQRLLFLLWSTKHQTRTDSCAPALMTQSCACPRQDHFPGPMTTRLLVQATYMVACNEMCKSNLSSLPTWTPFSLPTSICKLTMRFPLLSTLSLPTWSQDSYILKTSALFRHTPVFTLVLILWVRIWLWHTSRPIGEKITQRFHQICVLLVIATIRFCSYRYLL